MTRKDRIKQQITEAKQAYMAAFNNGDIMGLSRIKSRIANLENEVAEIEKYETKRLIDILPRELLRTEKIPSLVAEIHMLMDCLIDATDDFVRILDKYGIQEHTIASRVRGAYRLLNDFIGEAYKISPFVADFLANNEDLVADVRKLTKAYVERQLDTDRKAEAATSAASKSETGTRRKTAKTKSNKNGNEKAL